MDDYKKAYELEINSNPFAWQQTALYSSFDNNRTLGLYQFNQLCAFVIYQSVLDEAEILHVVCHHQYTHRGLATRLLTALLDKLQSEQINQLFLEVRVSNCIAKHLYQKLGFISIGTRPNYYRNHEDAELMQLKIESSLVIHG